MADTENLPPRRSTRLRPGTTNITPLDTTTSPSSTVSPLRISKNRSKSKTTLATTEDTSLRDISPGSSRRNSPSTFHIKEKLAALQSSSVATKSPPTSPPPGLVKSENTSSVRNFWQKGAAIEDSSEQKRKSEGEDLKSLRSSYVKSNIFLANDMRERESSPKLTMSPTQQRLSNQLGETTPTPSPSKIPTPVDATQSSRKDTRPATATSTAADVTPKASCLHSNRIKGPRQNASSDSESPTPVAGRRERRKTVTFDEAPQVLQFDRRSSHGTTSSEHSSATYDSEDATQRESKSEGKNQFERPFPPRPLPQVPPQNDDRPASKESNDTDYSDMEERIRSMMERVVLRDANTNDNDNQDQEDIFSLYTTTNEMEDDSQDSSAVFSSQATTSTGMSSQVNSQDEELERQLALQKQSEELLNVVKTRPFSLAELPDLGFGDDADEDLGGGLGLRQYCSPEPEKPQLPASPSTQVSNIAMTEKLVAVKQEPENFPTPITPPLESSKIEPQTPQEQIFPLPETLPTTPPASPHKPSPTEEEDTVPSPVVPEREATIRSRGGSKLRVRPSLSRQEAESIVARRRKSELPPLPNLNDIREASVEPEVKVKIEEDENLSEFGGKLRAKVDPPVLKIDSLGFEKDAGESGFGEMAVEEMERVIEAQKVQILKIVLTVAWVYDETTFQSCSRVEWGC